MKELCFLARWEKKVLIACIVDTFIDWFVSLCFSQSCRHVLCKHVEHLTSISMVIATWDSYMRHKGEDNHWFKTSRSWNFKTVSWYVKNPHVYSRNASFALNCVVCPLIYGFWLPLWYLHTLLDIYVVII
jgi:hypothetical protein